jgi:hypothetical protein
MCHRIRWNQVGFQIEADVAQGRAANSVQRMTPNRKYD